MSNEAKIIQIIPAVGWRALYAEDEGGWYYSDLVYWALLDNENIEPVDADTSGYADYFCRETTNLAGIYGPSVIHTPLETQRLVDNWRRRKTVKRKAT